MIGGGDSQLNSCTEINDENVSNGGNNLGGEIFSEDLKRHSPKSKSPSEFLYIKRVSSRKNPEKDKIDYEEDIKKAKDFIMV